MCGSFFFCPSWIVGDWLTPYSSEIPPAGAPAGFDYAVVGGCCARRFASPRRSAQDDTVGYSGRVMYNSHPSWIERKVLDRRKKRNDTWVVPYKLNKPHFPTLTLHRPRRAKQGRNPEAPPQIPLGASFRASSKSPKLHRTGQPDLAKRRKFYALPSGCPVR